MDDCRPIAIFDFDHTLTLCDSLWRFMEHLYGKTEIYWKAASLLPQWLGFICGTIERQAMKEAFLSLFLKGLPRATLNKKGAAFAKDILPHWLNPTAMARLQWHRARGDRLILISASIDTYLIPWGTTNGFEHVLTSQLAFDEAQHATGKLIGKNCWGEEKKTRLFEALGGAPRAPTYVYGDSEGDRSLLELATYPFYRKFI